MWRASDQIQKNTGEHLIKNKDYSAKQKVVVLAMCHLFVNDVSIIEECRLNFRISLNIFTRSLCSTTDSSFTPNM